MDSKCFVPLNGSTLQKRKTKRAMTKIAINCLYFIIAVVIGSVTSYLAVKFFQILAYICIVNKPMSFTPESIETNISGEFIISISAWSSN